MRFLKKNNKKNTFESVSSVKVLANENQSEQEDGPQAQRADQHSAQIHICKHTEPQVALPKQDLFMVKERRGKRRKQYLQINATVLRWSHLLALCALRKGIVEKVKKKNVF